MIIQTVIEVVSIDAFAITDWWVATFRLSCNSAGWYLDRSNDKHHI